MHRFVGPITGLCAILLLAPAAAAAEDVAIRKAVERGVAALKKSSALKGDHRYGVGATALVGLTLLECGVPADDPAVEEATRILRRAAPRLTHTYTVSLAIAYFDRLGDPADKPTIRVLGARLRAGQTEAGGWSYHCPLVSVETVLGKPDSLEKGAASPPEPEPSSKGKFKDKGRFDDEPQQPRGPPANGPEMKKLTAIGDNSNTQFAAMGLWIARRHGVAVEDTLARLGNRFRDSQNTDGGWGYTPRSTGLSSVTTPSMTCAGLFALAVCHGDALEAPRPRPSARKLPAAVAGDTAIRNGLNSLGNALNVPANRDEIIKGIGDRTLRRGYYFLWSLERVAIILDLDAINGKDWHQWGAKFLLAAQNNNGTWDGEVGPDIDTCFALLFLRRSNLAKDLTALLRARARVAVRPGENPNGANVAVAVADAELLDALRLRGELLRAPAELRPKLLERLRDAKGGAYTRALASAIAQLDDAGRKSARDALAERLARMTAATLRDLLKEDDPEVRRAAALACGMKDDKTHIPDLIPLVEDSELLVVRAVRASLKSLTGQDFGPAADAAPAERVRAAAAWRDWWARQQAGKGGK